MEFGAKRTIAVVVIC